MAVHGSTYCLTVNGNYCGIQAIAWAARNGRILPDRGLLVSENINNN